MYHARLWTTRRFLYSLLSKTGRPSEAEEELRHALVHSRTMAETASSPPSYRDQFASDYTTLGDLLSSQGRVAEARDCYERAIAIREQLVKDYPHEAQFRIHLAWSLRRRGLAWGDLGDLAGAAADTRRALAVLGRPADEDGRGVVRGRMLRHASLAGLAGRDGSAVPAVTAAPEAAVALDLLKKAIGLGYHSPRAYVDERALNLLRDRPEFRLLMMDLAFPADPFAR